MNTVHSELSFIFRLLIHAAHIGCCRSGRSRLLDVSDKALGGQYHRSDGSRVLQCGASDLGRVNDTGGDHVGVLLLERVEAVADLILTTDVLYDDGALQTRVLRDLLDRRLERFKNDLHTGLGVACGGIEQLCDSRDRVDQRYAAACDDALLNSRLSSGESVLDAHLLLLHLDLGGSADLDNGYAAGELRQALLQLLTIEIGGGILDLLADLTDAVLDLVLVALTVNDDRIFLGDLDLTRTAELVDGSVLELQTEVGGDDGTAFPYVCRQSPAP